MRYKSLDLIFLNEFCLKKGVFSFNKQFLFAYRKKQAYVNLYYNFNKKLFKTQLVKNKNSIFKKVFLAKRSLFNLLKIVKALVYIIFMTDKKNFLQLRNGGNFILFDFFYQVYPRIDLYDGKKNFRLVNSEDKYGFKFYEFMPLKNLKKKKLNIFISRYGTSSWYKRVSF